MTDCNTAIGFACPACGHSSRANVQVYRIDPETHFLLAMRLSCHSCEYVWEQPFQ
jgi:C4-type Zn-finger protein